MFHNLGPLIPRMKELTRDLTVWSKSGVNKNGSNTPLCSEFQFSNTEHHKRWMQAGQNVSAGCCFAWGGLQAVYFCMCIVM